MTGKDYVRLRNFGIEAHEYAQMLEDQHDVCAICDEKQPDGRDLAVDHDHETGEVRGLLCTRCNTGLGMFKDNTRLLAGAIVYLEDAIKRPKIGYRKRKWEITKSRSS